MKNILIVISLLFLLISCSNPYQIGLKEVKNKKLILIGTKDMNISKDSKAYLTMNNNTFIGFSGCNDFNGTYKIDDKRVHFIISNVGTNVCKNIDIQHSFLDNLVKSRYILSDKNISFFQNDNKKTILIFKK